MSIVVRHLRQIHPLLVPDIVTVGDVNPAFLAGFLHIEFSGEPWNEHLMCPRCKPEYDFGPDHTWGDKSGLFHCPDCGSELTTFWSPDRVEAYLSRPGCAGYVLCYRGQRNNLALWIWGYPLSQEEFYLDTVAVPKRYRRLGGFKASFWDYVAYLKDRGHTRLRTRTHKDSEVVRTLLASLGFIEGEDSAEDPARSYWRLTIPSWDRLNKLIESEAEKIPSRFRR